MAPHALACDPITVELRQFKVSSGKVTHLFPYCSSLLSVLFLVHSKKQTCTVAVDAAAIGVASAAFNVHRVIFLVAWQRSLAYSPTPARDPQHLTYFECR
jgi:hypothetical protein